MKLTTLISRLQTDSWLANSIDDYYEISSKEMWESEPNLAIHPSSSSGSCVRSMQLGMLGHRVAKTVTRRRLENGTDAHERWNTLFEDLGLLSEANVRLELTSPVVWSGEVDVILKHPISGKLIIGELKTMNSQRWEQLPSQAVRYTDMMEDLFALEERYAIQLTQYLHVFNGIKGTDRLGFFLFENTDTQEYKILWVEPTDEHVDRAFGIPLDAQNNLYEGILVDAPFAKDSNVCRLCKRQEICFALQDGTDIALALDVSKRVANVSRDIDPG